MKKNRKLQPPFFEVGPKAYAFGKEMVELAKYADQLSIEYDVRIIVTPQYVDIPLIAAETENVFVFAQHMDWLPIGRGIGSVLPEALKAAGTDGVFLNHVEKRVPMEDLIKTISRAKEVGLMTFVCADTVDDALILAKETPTFIVVESPDMIGGGKTRDQGEYEKIKDIEQKIHGVNKDILLFHGAGINNAQDVFDVVSAGANGTGSSSALFLAENPREMLEKMIQAVNNAWDIREQKKYNEVNK
jgi:triosephosphate isomerase